MSISSIDASTVILPSTEPSHNTTFQYLDDNPSDEFVPPPTGEISLNLESAIIKAVSHIHENQNLYKEEIITLNTSLFVENELTLDVIAEKQISKGINESDSSLKEKSFIENENVELSQEHLSEQLFFDSQELPPFNVMEENISFNQVQPETKLLEKLEQPELIKMEQSRSGQSEPDQTDSEKFEPEKERIVQSNTEEPTELKASLIEPVPTSLMSTKSSPSKSEQKKIPQLNEKLDRLVDEIALDFLIDKLAENINFDQLIADIFTSYASKMKSLDFNNQVRNRKHLIK